MLKTKIIINIFFLLSGFQLFAQGNKAQEVKESFWGANDKWKNTTEIPDKWKGESAVVIYQEFRYTYQGAVKSVDYVESVRRRIKLLDKAAVDEFSEFSFADKFKVKKGISSFRSKTGKTYIGIKIIKPNGTATEIDLNEAKEAGTKEGAEVKKIAIPNLEQGDIIDFYYYTFEPFQTPTYYIFSPVITTLGGPYPIMEQKLLFDVGKNFYINFQSAQGAPELTEQRNSIKKTITYLLEDADREKNEVYRWFYKNRSLPIVKFQVAYARVRVEENYINAFVSEKGRVQKEINLSRLERFYGQGTGRLVFNYEEHQKELAKYLKSKGLENSKNKAKVVREAYYYLRHQFVVSKIEPLVLYKSGLVTTLPNSFGGFLTEAGFVRSFGTFLQKKGIDFDIILTIPRNISDIETVLLKKEISLMLRVNLKQPIFVYKFGIHSNYNEFPSSFEGTNAFYYSPLGYYERTADLVKMEIPVSSHQENNTKVKLDVSFDENIDVLNIKRRNIISGYAKNSYQSPLISLYDYTEQAYKKYGTGTYLQTVKLNKKKKEILKRGIRGKKEADKKDQKEDFKQNAEDDYGQEIKNYNEYNIESLGRDFNKSKFIFTDSFELEGLVKKAGKNYIFPVGQLMGSQVELDKKDKEPRKHDIYMPFARSFEYDVTLTIPEGYSVKGIEDLNFSVENETGGFTSVAKIEDNKLLISTLKYYTHNFEKAENWSKMVEFLEAAYQFSQQKILLKKD